MGKRAHVLAVPFPAQGHVKPLLNLACKIASHGIKVTFVNTHSTHKNLIDSIPDDVVQPSNVVFATIPDVGREAGDDGSELIATMSRIMPRYLAALIERVNNSSSQEDEQITCVLADASVGWTLSVAQNMGLQQAVFWTSAVGTLNIIGHIPELIESEIIDTNGNLMKPDELISLSSDIPVWKSTEFAWSFSGNPPMQKILFGICSTVQKTSKDAKWFLCNTFYGLESAACDLIPNCLPIGPLVSKDSVGSPGSLRPEDKTCLTWLDQKLTSSVIYVSFGSISVPSQDQFRELALGLELSGQPFLWVVRSDQSHGGLTEFLNGFLERVGDRGKIVEWTPQEKVLSHPSVACFLSHCGWNSTLEGLSVGVPFLCWPFFADQFHNEGYICDIWKVGLRVNPDENGIRSSYEIKTKIELLISNDNVKANALKLKTMAQNSICEGGSSLKNFENFINFLKA